MQLELDNPGSYTVLTYTDFDQSNDAKRQPRHRLHVTAEVVTTPPVYKGVDTACHRWLSTCMHITEVYDSRTHHDVQRPPEACRVFLIYCTLPLQAAQTAKRSSAVQSCSADNRAATQVTSSRVSNLQLLPSSVVSFHHLRPTSNRPETFLVCRTRCRLRQDSNSQNKGDKVLTLPSRSQE